MPIDRALGRASLYYMAPIVKAVVQDGYGSADRVLKVRDVDKPTVEGDEVLVRVRAASVHPDVWHVVTGRPYVLRLIGAGVFRPKNPIPGTDLAGVVESVGRDVSRFGPGDQVFGETHTALQWRNGGAFRLAVYFDRILLAGIGFNAFAKCRIERDISDRDDVAEAIPEDELTRFEKEEQERLRSLEDKAKANLLGITLAFALLSIGLTVMGAEYSTLRRTMASRR